MSDDVDNDNVDGIPSLIDCWVSMVLLIVSTNDCVTFCHTEALKTEGNLRSCVFITLVKDDSHYRLLVGNKVFQFLEFYFRCWNSNSSTTSNTLDLLWTTSAQQERRLFV
mmetsp:Transcript_2587/g.2856  ORF Transcript_2587/g.2856 Transcript_2587/m.2856 type:complete len:110 (-) Transcript_2587:147-476(-)